jgi:hypothetical protein
MMKKAFLPGKLLKSWASAEARFTITWTEFNGPD